MARIIYVVLVNILPIKKRKWALWIHTSKLKIYTYFVAIYRNYSLSNWSSVVYHQYIKCQFYFSLKDNWMFIQHTSYLFSYLPKHKYFDLRYSKVTRCLIRITDTDVWLKFRVNAQLNLGDARCKTFLWWIHFILIWIEMKYLNWRWYMSLTCRLHQTRESKILSEKKYKLTIF